MKKSVSRSILYILIILAVFIAAAAISAKVTKDRAEAKAAATGKVDYYSMSEYCRQNAYAVFDALKAGDSAALDKLLINSEGSDKVMDFADWSNADFDSAISMGSGSLTAEPDSEGRMDVSERFFVDVGDERYVFFIETLTSGRGRINDGVSAVSVTSYPHFDATDYDWNGEDDGESAVAGELFWK